MESTRAEKGRKEERNRRKEKREIKRQVREPSELNECKGYNNEAR